MIKHNVSSCTYMYIFRCSSLTRLTLQTFQPINLKSLVPPMPLRGKCKLQQIWHGWAPILSSLISFNHSFPSHEPKQNLMLWLILISPLLINEYIFPTEINYCFSISHIPFSHGNTISFVILF